MSAAENKKLMQEIFARLANRDGAMFYESLADDATWTVTGQYSWSRTFKGKEAIARDLIGHLRTRLIERTRTIAHRFVADGDVVVVEAHGDNMTREGVRYDNEYCLVYRLDGGKIKEIREYCDSTLVEVALGPFPAEALAKAG
jgi:ketosteroid isomerase-like protein